VATLVAVAGLLVTMIFNTLAVRENARQSELQADEAARSAEHARAARLDTQIGMLTSLSTFFQQTAPAVDRAGNKLCNPQLQLSAATRAELLRQVGGYDYLAWLFNQRTWTMESAKRYWGPGMMQAFQVAATQFRVDEVIETFPELARFVRNAPKDLKPPRPHCR